MSIETKIYGLVSGPSWLAASLTVDLVKSPYDKCLFILFSDEAKAEGQVLLDVDDSIEGGSEYHRKIMSQFHSKYDCGKAVDLREAGETGTLFAGRRVVQHNSFQITVTMDEYVRDKLHPIDVPRGYLSSDEPFDDSMLGWLRLRESMGDWGGWLPPVDPTWPRCTRSYLPGT